jgi:hypothetical protein
MYIDLQDPEEESVPRLLGEIYAQYGSEPRALAKPQRDGIYKGLFGTSTTKPNREEAGFPRLAAELIDASTAFAERVFDTGVEMLRERVRTTHRPFRQYLDKLSGDSVIWARDRVLLPLSFRSYTVLRNKGVAAVFGINTPPLLDWPFVEDANGDTLIEEIGGQLSRYAESERADIYVPTLTRERFSNLQRLALRGAEALMIIRLFDESAGATPKEKAENVDTLISASYTWGAALKSLQ